MFTDILGTSLVTSHNLKLQESIFGDFVDSCTQKEKRANFATISSVSPTNICRFSIKLTDWIKIFRRKIVSFLVISHPYDESFVDSIEEQWRDQSMSVSGWCIMPLSDDSSRSSRQNRSLLLFHLHPQPCWISTGYSSHSTLIIKRLQKCFFYKSRSSGLHVCSSSEWLTIKID